MSTLLGGLHAGARFSRATGRSAALLVRDAMPGFTGLFDAASADRACRARRRRIAPRRARRAAATRSRTDRSAAPTSARCRARDWTLLVQGVNLHRDAADALLRRFAFIPFARLDDLMVSYAAPGGGVGPHFDSLRRVPAAGLRPAPLALRPAARPLAACPDLPLKILRALRARARRVLAPGDMLYLPPQYAHDGVAVDACTTYSIGFRAASSAGARAGVPRLPARPQSTLAGPLRRSRPRPDARAGAHRRAHAAPRRRGSLARFAGTARTSRASWAAILSEPKPNVCFEPPRRAALAARVRAAHRHARAASSTARTQLLYDDDALVHQRRRRRDWPRAGAAPLRGARQRAARCRPRMRGAAGAALIALLHEWLSPWLPLHPA